MKRCSLLVASVAASAALLIVLPSRAEPAHDAVTLTYLPSPRVAALCPEADFLAFEIMLRLRYELVQPSAPNHLTVEVEREQNGLFRTAGEIRDEDEKVIFAREYTAIDCTSAVISMALGVAIKFTTIPEPSPPAPPPSPPTSTPLPPPPAPSPPCSYFAPPCSKLEAPEPSKSPALFHIEPPDIQLGLASVFSIGLSPVVVGGVAGFVGLRWGRVLLALEGSYVFTPTATLDGFSTPGGWHYSVTTGAALGCYPLGPLLVCGRGEVRALSISNSHILVGRGLTSSFGFGPRVSGEWEITPLIALRAYGEIVMHSRTTVLQDRTTMNVLWPGSVGSFSIGLGPVFSFRAF
jgi:hypothetical protein